MKKDIAERLKEFPTLVKLAVLGDGVSAQAIEVFSRDAMLEIEALRGDVARLEPLVHVPGVWRCAKCDFRLIQSNLNASDGTATARDTPGDKCPNCHSPLWRVTERQERIEAMELAETGFTRAGKAENALQDLADSADAVGVRFFDADTMEPEVEAMQRATLAAREVLEPNTKN